MGVTDEVGKVAGSLADSMKGTPVLIAFLVVIAGFLAFNAWRDNAQFELIAKLVTECRQGKAAP